MSVGYRADIDGLRAVAVLSVIFFHAGISLFSGGFVGVDVFFVISGYLITSIIIKEIQSNEFTITRFYERRIRRIFPALFVMVIFCAIAGAFLLVPEELKGYGKSLIAATGFVSNIYFWQNLGYFDAPSEYQPLLHTWSLAVEEQYYIIFPIFIIAIARYLRAKYFPLLLVALIVSLMVSEYLVKNDQTMAFYLASSRAWELLLGSVISLHVIRRPSSGALREMTSFLGLVLVLSSVCLYTPQTEFPGLAAIPPTLGAGLIIYSGTGGSSFIKRILSFRPIVFVGIISYSLYLWHWPVIVFAKKYKLVKLSNNEIFFLLLFVLIVAIVSWKYVEVPFRKRMGLMGRRQLFLVSGGAMALLISLGLFAIISNGIPDRSEITRAIAESNDSLEWNKYMKCEGLAKRISDGSELCSIGTAGKIPGFLLWGDSHAQALASSIDISSSRYGLAGSVATMSACPPLLGVDRPSRKTCRQFNDEVMEYIVNHSELDTIVLAARWALSADGQRYKSEIGEEVILVEKSDVSLNSENNAEVFKAGLIRTVEKLHALNRKVVLVSQVPEVGYDVPSSYLSLSLAGRDANKIIAPTLDEYNKRNHFVSKVFDVVSNSGQVMVVNPSEKLCDLRSCKVLNGTMPLYSDDDHLSTYGAKYVSSIFDPIFKKVN